MVPSTETFVVTLFGARPSGTPSPVHLLWSNRFSPTSPGRPVQNNSLQATLCIYFLSSNPAGLSSLRYLSRSTPSSVLRKTYPVSRPFPVHPSPVLPFQFTRNPTSPLHLTQPTLSDPSTPVHPPRSTVFGPTYPVHFSSPFSPANSTV
jgi:hypothetical protein